MQVVRFNTPESSILQALKPRLYFSLPDTPTDLRKYNLDKLPFHVAVSAETTATERVQLFHKYMATERRVGNYTGFVDNAGIYLYRIIRKQLESPCQSVFIGWNGVCKSIYEDNSDKKLNGEENVDYVLNVIEQLPAPYLGANAHKEIQPHFFHTVFSHSLPIDLLKEADIGHFIFEETKTGIDVFVDFENIKWLYLSTDRETLKRMSVEGNQPSFFKWVSSNALTFYDTQMKELLQRAVSRITENSKRLGSLTK